MNNNDDNKPADDAGVPAAADAAPQATPPEPPPAQPPAAPAPPEPPAADGTPPAEERQLAMFVHLSALLGGLLTAGWGCFIGPLLIWLIKKDTMPFVDDQGKEALNFNITMLIAYVVLWLLTVITLFIGGLITFPLMFVLGLAWLILSIVAAVKANEGVRYRYPFTWRIIK